MSFQSLRFKTVRLGVCLLASLPLLSAQAAQPSQPQDASIQPTDYVDLVDPYICSARGRWFFFGTGKRPFGMVNVFPDTKNAGQGGGGYNFSNTDVLGFCHLHGWMTVGLDLMPTTGGNYALNKDGWKSPFTRDKEIVRPGYHKVTLDKYAMDVEITSTERVGYHRYTYTNAGRADIIVSLGGKSGSGYMVNGHVEAVSPTQLEGYYDRVGAKWYGPPRVRTFFVIELDRPFSKFDTWTNGASDRSGVVIYDQLEAGAELNMKVAVSFTSIDNARLNLETEADGRGFDEVAQESREVWNQYFSRIDVQGGSPELRTKFYTDLWHALMGRHKLNDVNGAIPDYTNGKGRNAVEWQRLHEVDGVIPGYSNDIGGISAELKVRQLPMDANGKAKYNYYNSDSFWLTNFNLNLLWGLGWPHILEDFANSFLEIDKWGGVLPRGPNGGGYSFIMTGNPATPLIVSAHNLGLLDDWSSEEVMEVIRRNHMPGGGMDRLWGERGELQFYIDNGWCPMWDTKDQFDMTGGLTLEWAFNDWCAAQLAKNIGDQANYDYFIERSQNYRNQWDASTGFMRPKRRDGSWYEKFDPAKWYGFVEGNAWTYTWYVPHDVPGLVELMGGADIFAEMLNHAFEVEMPHDFWRRGHNGLFDYGNQPSCGMAHLFNYAGKPWLTQYWTRKVSQIGFGGMTPHTGYCGEEDQGQMGALSALMKIGLFSERGACASEPIYDLTAPEFDEITIHLDPNYYSGKTFKIKAYNNAPDNCYIQKAKLNGKALQNSWIYQKDVAKGGVLELWLGDQPNKEWGTSLAPVKAGGATDTAKWRQYKAE